MRRSCTAGVSVREGGRNKCERHVDCVRVDVSANGNRERLSYEGS